MQTIDHKTLAYLLLSKNTNEKLNIFEKSFIFRCIEPDINLLTYMKGGIKYNKQNMEIKNDLKFIINICSVITNAIIKHEYDYLTISFIPQGILNESYSG